MSIRLELPQVAALRPRITVVGVGGAGGNAVNNMILSGLQGVDFVVANTDAQALQSSSAEHRIQLGVNLTEGLGAGSRPEIGEAAAEEAIEDIRDQVANSHMLFIAAGMGGGTGTGAAAVIARIAKDAGVLTVGIVTKPFQFEGTRRARIADAGIAELKKYVDTLIVIPNQNLFRIANEKTTFAEAFVLADQVLYSGIACIVDLIVKDGLINLDFADVRTVMKDMGTAVMGTGEGEGPRRAIEAAEEAIANPLLDDVSLKGARGLLLSITGGRDLTLYEVDEAASRVRQEVDPDANIIVGATFDDAIGDKVRVSIVATGMERAGSWGREAPEQPRALAPSAPEFAAPAAAPAVSAPAPPPPTAARVIPVQPATQAPAAPVQRAPLQPDLAAPQRPAVIDEQEELSRRLSAAFEYDDAEPPAHGDSGSHLDETATIAGEPWRAPGDVLIEETAPRTASLPPIPAAPPAHVSRAPVSAAAPAQVAPPSQPPLFEPAAPQDIRRGTRRMPELEDFPAVGQREYQAKSTRDAHPLPPPLPAEPAHGQAGGQKRKPGLLARLTGRAKGMGDSPASNTHYPQAERYQGAYAPDERGKPNRQAASGREQGGYRDQREDVELPVFFGGERK